MTFQGKSLLGLGLALLALASSGLAKPARDLVSRQLHNLAVRAIKRETWPRLLRYATSARTGEERGAAYFVLGYRQYEAGEYLAALENLRQAAESKFSLSDFAEYYRAAAADAAARPEQIVEALDGFRSRHPESPLRFEALALLARGWLDISQPERAIEVLTAEAQTRQRPPLALVLAQAYLHAQRLEEAARAFQEVYYAFPTAAESQAAGEALAALRSRLGPRFSLPTEEIQTARVEILYRRSRYADALTEYDALLLSNPASMLAGRWRVGRARCLLGLRRVEEARETLEASFPENTSGDAERLATLAEVYVRLDDAASLVRVLDELREKHLRADSYASALYLAGSFFIRQGDWQAARLHFQALAERFPNDDLGREAHWRLAWAYYLEGRNEEARQAFLNHLLNYPDSTHVRAALYWLGRLEEERGSLAVARSLFQLLNERFAHNYYSLQANLRLKALSRAKATEENAVDQQAAVPLAELADKIPPPEAPTLQPCKLASAGPLLDPFLLLRALSLDDLAAEYLKASLSVRPGAPEVLLALSRFQAESGEVSAALFSARDLVPNSPELEFSSLPREVWDLLYPRAYWRLVRQQARANGLDPHLVMGLIRQESAFNPRATSPADARGLMQILPRTAARSPRRRATVARRLYEPGFNVRLGCRYLKGRLKRFNGSVEQALAAYHAGDSRVTLWLAQRSYREPAEFVESIPIRNTRVYVKSVLRDAAIFRQLMTGQARFKERPRLEKTAVARQIPP